MQRKFAETIALKRECEFVKRDADDVLNFGKEGLIQLSDQGLLRVRVSSSMRITRQSVNPSATRLLG